MTRFDVEEELIERLRYHQISLFKKIGNSGLQKTKRTFLVDAVTEANRDLDENMDFVIQLISIII